MRKKIIILISLCTLSACATGVELSKTSQAKEEVPNGEGQMIIYRSGIFGTAIQPKIFVDGAETGRCKPRGAFIVKGKPGEYDISTSTEVTKTITVDLQNKETNYVRCSIGLGFMVGQPKLTPVAKAIGEKEASDLKLTGVHCLPSGNC